MTPDPAYLPLFPELYPVLYPALYPVLYPVCPVPLHACVYLYPGLHPRAEKRRALRVAAYTLPERSLRHSSRLTAFSRTLLRFPITGRTAPRSGLYGLQQLASIRTCTDIPSVTRATGFCFALTTTCCCTCYALCRLCRPSCLLCIVHRKKQRHISCAPAPGHASCTGIRMLMPAGAGLYSLTKPYAPAPGCVTGQNTGFNVKLPRETLC